MLAVAEVLADALAAPAAVVALETTLVAHGFPPGEGVAVGAESERRVREAGRGAGDDRRARRPRPRRAQRRGARALRRARRGRSGRATSPRRRRKAPSARRRSAARSRSAAPPASAVMATGGLGGVHRGWPAPPDVSADLGELARTRALVVCSGVKSLLDVPATMEVLETLGVPVLGWRTDSCRSSTPRAAARRSGPRRPRRRRRAIARAHWELGRRAALVLARPPTTSLDDAEPLIEEALEAREREGVTGAGRDAVRARLPARSKRRTDARGEQGALAANAGLAGELAVELAR